MYLSSKILLSVVCNLEMWVCLSVGIIRLYLDFFFFVLKNATQYVKPYLKSCKMSALTVRVKINKPKDSRADQLPM